MKEKFYIKYSYLLLILPVFICLLIVKSVIESNFTPERVLYTYLILYLLGILILNKRIKFIYTSIIYVVSIILSYIELCYSLLYHERVTASTIFVLLETNQAESYEYLSEYLNFKIVIGFLLLLIFSFYTLKGVKILIYNYSIKEIFKAIRNDLSKLINNRLTNTIAGFYKKMKQHKIKVLLFKLSLVSITIFIYVNKSHYKQHISFQLFDGYSKYQAESMKFKNAIQKKSQDLNVINNNKKEEETFVLIIGESTTKTHFQLYGYERETTPNLSKIKDELVVFNDVISPHTHTIASLEKMLTLGDYEHPDKKYLGNVIDIISQVGFKTYWISNQIPIGIYETQTTAIAKTASEVYFLNLGGEKEQLSYDEKVLPYVRKVLGSNEKKKFIVVHLLGTHVQYKNRYPKKYNVFSDNPKTDYWSDQAKETINQYDNAVLYNDYVVSEIINEVKKLNKKEVTVLYLSDHGEEVYETLDMAGHSEAISSKPMYLIPFIYWNSDIENVRAYQDYKERKYMADDLIFSITDLLGVSFNGYESTRSIFNKEFSARRRIIKDGKDFDFFY
ncbi:MAG: sulfatase-like hydrolase/transferase [Flavobacteriales bacterium]|nr:sulfatase-like hydrolase/transferase [Flavobacteriales bacterium]